MPQLLEPTLDEMIACVEREISMREHVYPRRIEQGRMKSDRADREIEIMKAVSRTLHGERGQA